MNVWKICPRQNAPGGTLGTLTKKLRHRWMMVGERWEEVASEGEWDETIWQSTVTDMDENLYRPIRNKRMGCRV